MFSFTERFYGFGYDDGNDISTGFYSNAYDYENDPHEHDAYYDGWISGRMDYYRSQGMNTSEAHDATSRDSRGGE